MGRKKAEIIVEINLEIIGDPLGLIDDHPTIIRKSDLGKIRRKPFSLTQLVYRAERPARKRNRKNDNAGGAAEGDGNHDGN